MSGTRYQTTDSIINLLNIKKETDPTQKLLNQIPESFLFYEDLMIVAMMMKLLCGLKRNKLFYTKSLY